MKRAVSGGAVLAAVGLVAWLGFAHRSAQTPLDLLPYQAQVSELAAPEQQRFAQVREQLRGAEEERDATGQWPQVLASEPDIRWIRLARGHYVNYLGVPASARRLRWLVMVIEPEAAAIRDPPAPEDDEHHTLRDGTGLHVTVWSAPNEGPLPEVVLPFPAAEGWTQRIRH